MTDSINDLLLCQDDLRGRLACTLVFTVSPSQSRSIPDWVHIDFILYCLKFATVVVSDFRMGLEPRDVV